MVAERKAMQTFLDLRLEWIMKHGTDGIGKLRLVSQSNVYVVDLKGQKLAVI
jgi:hypothetical protein